MKVLQFMASDSFGGAEKVFIELSNALVDSHDVISLVVRNCAFLDRFSDKVRVVELKSNPTRHNPFLHYEIYSVLKQLQPDIIHTHAAKGAELVNTVNRFLGFKHLATKHNDRKGRIFNSLPFVSAVSEKGRKSVYPQKNAELRVINNGVLEKVIEKQRTPNNVFTLLAVGRLDAIKGFDLLIKQVSKLNFPYKLLIVGEGSEKEKLRSLIESLGLREKVELAGFRGDIPEMMRDSDLVVISSHREGGPTVMIEAFFYAPLLLSTPVGMVPESVPQLFQSSIEEFADSISRLYYSYEESVSIFQDVAEKGRHQYSLQNVVRQYQKYYADIVSAS